MERAYPAIAIEVQQFLGIKGFAFDMNVACSSATFGIQAAADMIKAGSAETILIVDPEICSGHLDFKDRDCHFIFGDACVATIVQGNLDNPKDVFQIKDRELVTQFSNNIRISCLGFLKHYIFINLLLNWLLKNKQMSFKKTLYTLKKIYLL